MHEYTGLSNPLGDAVAAENDTAFDWPFVYAIPMTALIVARAILARVIARSKTKDGNFETRKSERVDHGFLR